MADDEIQGDDQHIPANKKLTIFVIDGSQEMFDGGNDCAFRRAIKVVFDQILNVCCSGTLNHMIGVVVCNTAGSQNRANHKFFYEWIPLSVPGNEEAMAIKSLLDSDDIHQAFLDKFEGHANCNLTHVMWGCRKVMQLSATSIRHHMIMYFTCNSNPFGDDNAGFEKFKKLMLDFTCTSYRDRAGLRKVVKTPGEFHVAMLCDDLKEEDRKKWSEVTSHVFHGNIEGLEAQAYKKTFSQRAFSLVNLELAPGVKIGVGVYLLAGEARPPTKMLLDAETESKVERRVHYITKSASDETMDLGDEDDVKETEKARELKKTVKIGKQNIVTDQKELAELAHFDAKGIVLLGFKPINDLDITKHIQSSQLLYPDDSNIRGSVTLYRALHARCAAREMAMICRFCSRSNQKIRLVALVPQKKLSDKEMVSQIVDIDDPKQRQRKLDELRLANEYRHNAFLVIFLPFAEDLRDVQGNMECPMGEWPKPSVEDVDVTSQLIRNLTKPYTPESFFNPRLRSFNAMLIDAAVGEKVSREDSILPYFKSRRFEFSEKLRDSVVEHFELEAEEPVLAVTKRPAGSSSDGAGKRAKTDITSMTTEEIAKQGLLEKMTVAQLKVAVVECGLGKPPQGAKKADLVAMLTKHFA